MAISLYVHIPYCLKKCAYCDFASQADTAPPLEEYVAAVVREMESRAPLLDGSLAAATLYIGGGTPSLMAPSQVSTLIGAAVRCCRLLADAEVTIEANPGTVTYDSLSGYRWAGVSRLSLGVQSFDDRMLSFLGRVHTAAESREAVGMARAAGFDNLGIDLIHSQPGQSAAQWHKELQQAIDLGPEHLSVYGLTVEEGTPLYRLQEEGSLSLPDEASGAEMYRMTAELLSAAGFEQYEISNFARPGRRSRHNEVYWRRGNYLGFGAAAHSFLRSPCYGRRWHNPNDTAAYLQAIASGVLPEEDVQIVSRREAMAETLFLGLRMTEGIDREEFRAEFGETIDAVYGEELSGLIRAGFLRQAGGRISIPPDKMILSNAIFLKFL